MPKAKTIKPKVGRPAKAKLPKLPKELKLDLACGDNKREGFIGVDIVKTKSTDIVHDLEKYPWPFKDNSVSEAHISNYFEHLNDPIKFMNELHRVMKKGAQCTVISPYYSSMRAWQDPTHRLAVSEASFLYYNQDWLKTNHLEHYGVTADFDFSYGYVFYPEWLNRSEESRVFAIQHYINVVSDIQVTLTKK
jgi:SAM-dependent methyltransferase